VTRPRTTPARTTPARKAPPVSALPAPWQSFADDTFRCFSLRIGYRARLHGVGGSVDGRCGLDRARRLVLLEQDCIFPEARLLGALYPDHSLREAAHLSAVAGLRATLALQAELLRGSECAPEGRLGAIYTRLEEGRAWKVLLGEEREDLRESLEHHASLMALRNPSPSEVLGSLEALALGREALPASAGIHEWAKIKVLAYEAFQADSSTRVLELAEAIEALLEAAGAVEAVEGGEALEGGGAGEAKHRSAAPPGRGEEQTHSGASAPPTKNPQFTQSNSLASSNPAPNPQTPEANVPAEEHPQPERAAKSTCADPDSGDLEGTQPDEEGTNPSSKSNLTFSPKETDRKQVEQNPEQGENSSCAQQSERIASQETVDDRLWQENTLGEPQNPNEPNQPPKQGGAPEPDNALEQEDPLEQENPPEACDTVSPGEPLEQGTAAMDYCLETGDTSEQDEYLQEYSLESEAAGQEVSDETGDAHGPKAAVGGTPTPGTRTDLKDAAPQENRGDHPDPDLARALSAEQEALPDPAQNDTLLKLIEQLRFRALEQRGSRLPEPTPPALPGLSRYAYAVSEVLRPRVKPSRRRPHSGRGTLDPTRFMRGFEKLYRNPSDGDRGVAVHLHLLLDLSGSMGEPHTRLTAAKQVVSLLMLAADHASSPCSALGFSGGASVLKSPADSLDHGLESLSRAQAQGGTQLGGALERSLSEIKRQDENTVSIVVFISDGDIGDFEDCEKLMRASVDQINSRTRFLAILLQPCATWKRLPLETVMVRDFEAAAPLIRAALERMRDSLEDDGNG